MDSKRARRKFRDLDAPQFAPLTPMSGESGQASASEGVIHHGAMRTVDRARPPEGSEDVCCFPSSSLYHPRTWNSQKDDD